MMPRTREQKMTGKSDGKPIRIAIVGTHSAGKTTLAKAITERLDLPYIEGDITRKVVKNVFFKEGPLDLTEAEYWELQLRILANQMIMETNHPEFVSDGATIMHTLYLGCTLNLTRDDPAYMGFHNLCIKSARESYSHVISASGDTHGRRWFQTSGCRLQKFH
ncbi:MAG: hypothetical protein DRI57_17510 [Deltaproteobacteria bacterium]|nr:MAG: hypothetical protein DRI57_17510 [Deltaproteobacteria bacterium]